MRLQKDSTKVSKQSSVAAHKMDHVAGGEQRRKSRWRSISKKQLFTAEIKWTTYIYILISMYDAAADEETAQLGPKHVTAVE